MKTIAILSVAVALLAINANGYSSDNDGIDVESLVNNPEKLQTFFNCLVGKEPCSKLSQTFKDLLPEVLQESCAKCNPVQKKKLKVLLQGMTEKLPEFSDFKKKADPEGKLFPALEAAIADA